MRITPMDIQQQQFKIRFRGFDVQEVDSFLELVAAELKEVLHENSSLKDEVKRLEEALASFREKEKNFQTAFISAQRVIDDMKANTERQARLAIAQAEVEAEKIVERARVQAARLQEQIDQLKRQKAQMEHRVKSFIESLSVWLVAEKETSDLPEVRPAVSNSKPVFSLAEDQQRTGTSHKEQEATMEIEEPGTENTDQASDPINKMISEVILEAGKPAR